jgi:hypothetical protein
VKLRSRTPTSGRMANAKKISRAGSAIHATEPLRPPREPVGRVSGRAGGARVVTAR